MNGLRYCAEILALFLFTPWCDVLSTQEEPAGSENSTSSLGNTTSEHPEIESTPTPSPPLLSQKNTLSTTLSVSKPTALLWRTECLQELMVCGGLIVACAFFLMTTLLLTCKVCRLSGRIRKLSRSAEVNSDPAFSGAKKDKSESGAGAKETAVLMSYVSQTNLEQDSAATKQDAGTAGEDEQKAEEKKEGGPPKGEEAPPPAAEAAAGSSTFSQPQGEAAGSESTLAAAAAAPSSPCPEGTAEPENQP